MRSPHLAAAIAGLACLCAPFMPAVAGGVVVVQAAPAPTYCRTVAIATTGSEDASEVFRVRRCDSYAGAYYYPYSYATGAWYASGTTTVYGASYYGTPYYGVPAYGVYPAVPYRAAATTGTYTWQSGSVNGVGRDSAGYDAWTGRAAAGSSRAMHDSASGTWAAGQRVDAANVYNGNYVSAERGAAYNETTGAAAAGSHGTVGNAQSGRQLEGGRGVVYDPVSGQATRAGGVRGENGGVGHVNNTFYVNRNGNVQSKTLERPSQRPRGNSGRRRR